jgi:hypothetical protein
MQLRGGCLVDYLDKQMQQWSTRLRDDLKIGPPESNQLATTIAKEVAALSDDAKQRVKDTSQIPLMTRIEELVGFQGFMDHVGVTEPRAVLIRAQVVYQNYICFVYLGESCFNVLKKELPSGSTGKKCFKFLTDNPVRAFRNAVAHANWRYLPDFSGLEFWARKGAESTDPMIRFEVSTHDLDFWQALARSTAYASFLSL